MASVVDPYNDYCDSGSDFGKVSALVPDLDNIQTVFQQKNVFKILP
jgi:hypothetical protein